jgi:hypothetical protein
MIKNQNKIKMKNEINQNASSGVVYVLGIIGAAFYFFPKAVGFWSLTIGFLKAMAWPAFLVYEAFRHFAI